MASIGRDTHVGVFGGTGNVGRYLVYKLTRHEQVTSVTVFTRDVSKARHTLSQLYAQSIPPPKLNFRLCDLSRPHSIISDDLVGLTHIAIASGSRHLTRISEVMSLTSSSQHPRVVDFEAVCRTIDCIMSVPSITHVTVISSCGVTRPWWHVSLLLNSFISCVLQYKLDAELYIRQRFHSLTDKTYTIIRPGGLSKYPLYHLSHDRALDECVAGENADANIVQSFAQSSQRNALTSVVPVLTQGDTVSGRISHDATAELVVQSLFHPRARNVTVECVYPTHKKRANTPATALPAYQPHSFEADSLWDKCVSDLQLPPLMSTDHSLPLQIISSASLLAVLLIIYVVQQVWKT